MKHEGDALAVGLEESPRRLSERFRNQWDFRVTSDPFLEVDSPIEDVVERPTEMHVDSAQDLSNGDWHRWLERATEYSVVGKYHLSVALLKRVVKRTPKNPEAWHHLGFAFEQLNRRNEALDCYSKAIRLAPRWAEAWNNRGGIHLKLKKTIEAVHDFEQAVGLSPESPLFWINLALAQSKSSSSDRASISFQRATDLDPTNDLIWFRRGRFLVQRGDRLGGQACFRTCCMLNPSNFGAWISLLLGMRSVKDWPRFESSQVPNRQQSQPPLNLGLVIPSDRYLANKRSDSASDRLQKIWETVQNPVAWMSVLVFAALLYILLGK